jgi:stearoyl-CoA desaturase (delta-9 desaturase)
MIDWLNVHAPLAGAPVPVYVIATLMDTHITAACVTLSLHRCQTHRSIACHPAVAHFMRAWLWLRTAMPTREWVSVHRCHHAHVDTAEDPHSPIVYGIRRVGLLGTHLYHTAAHNETLCRPYGKGTPDGVDSLLRRVRHQRPRSLVG